MCAVDVGDVGLGTFAFEQLPQVLKKELLLVGERKVHGCLLLRLVDVPDADY